MDLFVYGTLTDPDRAAAVLDGVDHRFGPEAVLEGLDRVDCRYPTLVPGDGIAGRILEVEDVVPVDRYEGVSTGPYFRVSVTRSSGGTADVYVGDPARLDCPDGVGWPGSGPFERRVRAYVGDENVVLR